MLQSAFNALQSGDARAAEAAARRALATLPDDEEALLVLALSLDAQSRYDDALAAFERLAVVSPGVAEYRINQGAMLRLLGRDADAERVYRDALSIDPAQSEALRNLGLIALSQQRNPEAFEFLMRAYELAPDDALIRAQAAKASHAVGDDASARRLLDGWRTWCANEPGELLDVAWTLMRVERTADAEAALDLAARRLPDDPRVRLRQAELYERINRIPEARAALERLGPLDTAELSEQAAVVRALVATRGDDVDDAIRRHEAILEAPGALERHLTIAFGLARLYDRARRPDAAMAMLDRAHAAQMKQLAIDHPQAVSFDTMTITRRRLTPELVATWQHDGAPDAAASPIFVVGFPRSGTTLLETMLDAHPALTTMDEQPFVQNLIAAVEQRGLRYPQDLGALTRADLDALRAQYFATVASRTQADASRRLVDKNPLNLLRLPMIARVFPHARIVLALRHPCDVVLSNYLQMFSEPLYVPLCATLESTARGYADAFDAWLDHCRLLEPAVFELRHEDLVDDIDAAAVALADFLGVARHPAMTAFHEHARTRGFIGTPSYSQVVEPVNRKGVGRWTRYRSHFERVLPTLEPYLRRWNYPSNP
ncbi:tetratricopeptide repeat-containing sulfotransferase family protein [Tahibacter soli]|uniref:Sulfotransferase n=1 Tax=Tahibacter soli TaxID=2983605 RepID=A0A9X4BFL3_9GAMM|nr:sulfotransferase [Tahibacter soli]MDC8011310.1 sulfotransferase [Tahibacter soli]